MNNQSDRDKWKIEFKKRLYTFVLKLIESLDKLPNDRVSRTIGDQLIRSGTSILSNYIEASAASSKKDFTRFFEYSLKSTNESKIWVELLRDTNKIGKDDAIWQLNELEAFGKIIASSILTLKGKK